MVVPQHSDSDADRRRGWWAVAGGWFGFFLLWTLFILGWAQGDVPVSGAVESALAATMPAALLGVLVWSLTGILNWPDSRFLVFAVAHAGAMAVFTAIWTVSGPVTGMLLDGGSLSNLRWEAQTLVWRLFMGVLLYVIVAGLSYAARISARLRRQQKIAARAEAVAAKATLAALRSQLQPHFLFNALHSISSLIESDAERAADAMELLGDLLRYTVRERESDQVTLEEEWQFVSDYVALQRLRFGDRVLVDMGALDAAGQVLVPPFVLQPLVENAFVHGMSSLAGYGKIRVRAQLTGHSLVLLVEDNGREGVPRSAGEHQDGEGGSGLENLRLRLESIYGDRAKLSITPREVGGTTALIEMEGVT